MDRPGADPLTPPPAAVATPSLAVIGTGKRIGKTAVSAHLARLADAYHGHPSRRLTVVAITGTNGKTTTSLLVEALLGAGGRPTGVIGHHPCRRGGAAACLFLGERHVLLLLQGVSAASHAAGSTAFRRGHSIRADRLMYGGSTTVT